MRRLMKPILWVVLLGIMPMLNGCFFYGFGHHHHHDDDGGWHHHDRDRW